MDDMSETTENATQGGGQEPETVPQPAIDEAPTTGQEQDESQTTETPPQDDKPKETPRAIQRRFDELTRRAYENQRRAEAAEAQLRQMQQPNATAQAAPPQGYVPASEVERAAAQLVEAQSFNSACDAIADFGAEKFPDFDTALTNFRMLGGPPQPFLEALTALGKEDGARVFHDLGTNPDEAERIIRMSPARMGIELAKLAAKPAKVPAVSKAPPPITPIRAGRVTTDAEPTDDAEWRAWFTKKQRS